MRSSNSIALLAAGLLAPGLAHAAACCMGSTSPFPIRVGECEHVVVGLGVGFEHGFGRWDSQGALAPVGLGEQAITATLGAGLRLNRRWQVGLVAPARYNHRGDDEFGAWGGGVGDTTLMAQWDPKEEIYQGPPTPIFSASLRLPTGRDWSESEATLLEDVTGQPNPAATLGVALERSLGKTPWMVGVDGTMGMSTLDQLQPALSAYGSVGRYLGTAWSLMGTASYSASWAAMDGSASAVAKPRAGVRLVRGQRLAWRAWAGTDWDLPVPYVGRSSTQLATVSGGFAVVR